MYDEYKSNGRQAINAVTRDFWELMKYPNLLQNFVTLFARKVRSTYADAEVIAGLDTNGFFFSLLTAYKLQLPFVPVRKLRKLPGQAHIVEYTSRNEEKGDMGVQMSSCSPGQKVVIIDEKFATGGTMTAAVSLMKMLQVKLLGCIVVVEYTSHRGREVLSEQHPDVEIISFFQTQNS
jgi:adenine phosphoribosyltransferase